MPVKKIKIEVNDSEGNKITLSFQGKIPRNKVIQLLDFIELFGGVAYKTNDYNEQVSDLSKLEKLCLVVKRRFPIGWFTSQEALFAYEDTLNEPIGLSTVSTYLARLTNSGLLTRSGSRAERRYKIRRKSTTELQQIQQ